MSAPDLFGAFASPTRLRILNLLQQQKEICVCDLCCVLEEPQPKVSRHLALLERAKVVVEPAGAAAVAAVMDAPDDYRGTTVAVLSGGNIDPLLLMRVIRHGMAAAGRYLIFKVRIPDAPGALARLLTLLGEADANVLDVVHERTSASLHLDEVEVALQLETRGAAHAEEVLTAMASAGYQVSG